MRFVLQLVSGADAGKRLIIEPGKSGRFGRSQDAELVASEPHISRMHFRIDCSQSGCRIVDLQSRNGTFVNDERVTEADVRPGDEIRAGETKLTLRIERDFVPPAAEKRVEPQRIETPTIRRPPPGEPVSPKPPVDSHATFAKVPTPIPSARPYTVALADEDLDVRREALYAAAWARERWLIDHCAKQARRPSNETWDAILLLAILGQPSHVNAIATVTKFVELGPRRFRVLGAYGHPAVVPPLLDGMDGDPLAAVAAASAFSKIMGTEVESTGIVEIPSGDDPSDSEEVRVPDAKRARQHWNEVKSAFTKGTRWCRGFDLSQGASEEILERLDMESRWEACLRGRYEGTWKGSLIDLERFPQKRR
jgi:pSer/pThr/pTyr-binding forkhead associated (FHA) protein